ncbi:adenosine deaminase [Fusarium tjaetaba]|uniref:Adenosine deaminase n=1 Tax=Fusarium tjaetaba TaxID=1567544 RepID=A0A8H5QMJ5_9HYPO|nr:adenosine deaminase [Fusarium tjaetaba]KAF5617227.1 adenosine deaminase [Fusarium tjaetaba]
MEFAMPLEERLSLRQELIDSNDKFILDLPKVELHVHIEGTLTPELRWKLAKRNNQILKLERTGTVYTSLEQLRASYYIMEARPGHQIDNAEESFTFFEAYYGGFDVLVTEEDFYDLAMNYFEHVAGMNVRYCESFFDPQGHTRRGVEFKTVMNGFRRAQEEAEKRLNVKSKWIMCFLRDMSPESAMETYQSVLPYRDMVAGIGLDSDENDRPPLMFEEVYNRARHDGFRITAHCDVGNKDAHKHIRQVVNDLGTTGADRLDHGINAAQDVDIMHRIKERGIGMTLTPWGYLRHEPVDEIFPRIRTLFDAGIPIAIGSDDPAYMEDTWILHDWLLVKKMCEFSNREMATLAKSAIDICWAEDGVKEEMRRELVEVVAKILLDLKMRYGRKAPASKGESEQSSSTPSISSYTPDQKLRQDRIIHNMGWANMGLSEEKQRAMAQTFYNEIQKAKARGEW